MSDSIDTVSITKPLIRKFKLSELEGASYNPRNIADAAFQGLRDSLKTFGMLEMPVVNVSDGKKRLISGHQRIQAMKEEGFTHADCAVVSFDETRERMANLTMNNPAIQGTWDATKALPLIASIAVDLPKPDAMCFAQLQEEIRREADKISKKEVKKAEDATPLTPSTPNSQPNKIYKLGRHRLYSGDCLKGIPLLVKNKRVAACVTDPPYCVNFKNFRDPVNFPGRKSDIHNDDMEPEEWKKFVDGFCKLILKYTDGPCYVFGSCKEMPTLQGLWESNGGVLHRWLVWAKDSFGFGLGDYRNQHETCLYGYRAGLTPAPVTTRTNVIEVPRPHLNDLHPTQKPVEIIKIFVEDGSEPDDIVIDAFCGSGTVLVVCEELNRTAFCCETDLWHCDTIRKRYAEQVHGVGYKDWQTLTKP